LFAFAAVLEAVVELRAHRPGQAGNFSDASHEWISFLICSCSLHSVVKVDGMDLHGGKDTIGSKFCPAKSSQKLRGENTPNAERALRP
jgi:hypothetical protein